MKLTIVLILFIAVSCTKHTERLPASVDTHVKQSIVELYQVEEEISKNQELLNRMKVHSPGKHNSSKTKEKERLKRIINKLTPIRDSVESNITNDKTLTSGINETLNLNFYNPIHNYKQTLKLSNLKNYSVNKDGSLKKYAISLHNTKEYTLTLKQLLQEKALRRTKEERLKPSPYLKAKFTCKGPFKFKTLFRNREYAPNEIVKFNWHQSESNGQRVKATLSKASESCTLSFIKDKEKYGLQIVSEESIIPTGLKRFVNSFEYCQIPYPSSSDQQEILYLTAKYRSMSCPQEVESIRVLEKRVEAYNAKVKALLGTTLPRGMIKSENPYYPLNFDKAPELDGIFLSYLQFKRDFSGTVLERLIRYHAKKGTFIKILVAKVIGQKKELEMLESLDKEFPNVMVRLYKFNNFGKSGADGIVSQVHRTLHTKLFLTYSEKNNKNNTAIIGGRNIHDGFLLDKTPDFSKYPALTQYGPGKDDFFSHWSDLEVELKGKKTLETLIGQYNAIFEHDNTNFFFRSYSINKRTNKISNILEDSNKGLFRYFTSVPYKDGMALEKYMIEQFDAANESITIATPYFNLTEKLTRSIERAIERGIRIQVVTKLDLKRDIAAVILSDVNKKTVNKLVNRIEIFEYTKPSDILHSKVVLIDEKISLLGSVNFNQRSFYHDIEGVLAIHSKSLNKKLNGIIDGYKSRSRRITKEQDIKLWKSIIISIMQKAL